MAPIDWKQRAVIALLNELITGGRHSLVTPIDWKRGWRWIESFFNPLSPLVGDTYLLETERRNHQTNAGLIQSPLVGDTY